MSASNHLGLLRRSETVNSSNRVISASLACHRVLPHIAHDKRSLVLDWRSNREFSIVEDQSAGLIAALTARGDLENLRTAGSDFLLDGGVTAAFWFGELASKP